MGVRVALGVGVALGFGVALAGALVGPAVYRQTWHSGPECLPVADTITCIHGPETVGHGLLRIRPCISTRRCGSAEECALEQPVGRHLVRTWRVLTCCEAGAGR